MDVKFLNATIDAQGKAILPGIVNAHTHVLLLALRGSVEDMGTEAIYGYMTPISFAMTADEREAISLLGCLEAIRSGTTTLVEPFRHVVINVVSNIVHYGHPGIVDAVMVDGEFLMLDAKVACLDERKVVEDAQAAIQSAWRRLHAQSPDVPLPESLRRS